jgi:hyaluronan synthase
MTAVDVDKRLQQEGGNSSSNNSNSNDGSAGGGSGGSPHAWPPHRETWQPDMQQQQQNDGKKRGAARSAAVKTLLVLAIGTILAIKIYLMVFVIDHFIGAYSVVTTSLVFVAFLFTFARYRPPSQANAGRFPAKEPFVTVVVPAKNEPVIIKKTVASILGSTYGKVEAILVNDGSTDDTGKVMDQLKEENPGRVQVFHMKQNMGKRKAVREAITKGNPRGDIIVLVDSDTILDRHAIERLVRAFDDPDVGAAAGHALVLNVNDSALTKIQETWYDGQFFVMKGMESSLGSVTCCPGAFSGYRREAILPCLEAWSNDQFLGAEFKPGDDRHLTSYVLGGTKHYIDRSHKAWKVVYCDDAIVHTDVPNRARKFINQQIRWKKSWVRVFLFNVPFFYKNRPIASTLFFYTQMTLSFAAPFIALRALVYLPLQGRITDAIFYCLGLAFVGFMYALTYRMRHPESGDRWIYRLLMAPMSVGMSFMMYYSILTMRKSSWLTR